MANSSKSIWWDTHRRARCYDAERGEKYVRHPDISIVLGLMQSRYKSVVKTFNSDILFAAEQLITKGYSPVMVNVSSSAHPGEQLSSRDSPKTPLFNVEKRLFWRSNYIMTVDKSLYPLERYEAIYTPSVTFFKDSQLVRTKQEFTLAVIACPPISGPKIVKKGQFQLYDQIEDKSLMEAKLDMIFRIVLDKGHNCLLLRDFGPNHPIDDDAILIAEKIKQYPVPFVFIALDLKFDDSLSSFNRTLKRTLNQNIK